MNMQLVGREGTVLVAKKGKTHYFRGIDFAHELLGDRKRASEYVSAFARHSNGMKLTARDRLPSGWWFRIGDIDRLGEFVRDPRTREEIHRRIFGGIENRKMRKAREAAKEIRIEDLRKQPELPLLPDDTRNFAELYEDELT